jgi:radical SAM superfamily enzyme YgiQ (UPF0313 family)
MTVVRLPSFDQVKTIRCSMPTPTRLLHLETNPGNARALVQRHGDKEAWLNPPPLPLTTPEMDALFDLPYARVPRTRPMAMRASLPGR